MLCLGRAAFSGLCVDIDQIRKDNNVRTDVKRKGGLIIWDGGTAIACLASCPTACKQR